MTHGEGSGTITIPLSAAITALDIATEYAVFYYDVQSGDILAVEDPFESSDVEQDFQAEVDSHPERYIILPGLAELDEANLPGRFADRQAGDERMMLTAAARSLYAGTEFPRMLAELNLTERWNDFRDSALADVAREWAQRSGVRLCTD